AIYRLAVNCYLTNVLGFSRGSHGGPSDPPGAPVSGGHRRPDTGPVVLGKGIPPAQGRARRPARDVTGRSGAATLREGKRETTELPVVTRREDDQSRHYSGVNGRTLLPESTRTRGCPGTPASAPEVSSGARPPRPRPCPRSRPRSAPGARPRARSRPRGPAPCARAPARRAWSPCRRPGAPRTG